MSEDTLGLSRNTPCSMQKVSLKYPLTQIIDSVLEAGAITGAEGAVPGVKTGALGAEGERTIGAVAGGSVLLGLFLQKRQA
jgi:hypothetical protein